MNEKGMKMKNKMIFCKGENLLKIRCTKKLTNKHKMKITT